MNSSQWSFFTFANLWAAEAVEAENPRAVDAAPFYRHPRVQQIPRYTYFIQVDEEALRSEVDADLQVHMGSGHVNFVKAKWKPDPEDDGGGYEPVEGHTGEDVGWFKIAPDMLGAYLWDALNDETWHVYYKRSPGILYS